MSDTLEKVKVIIVDCLEVNAENISEESRFVEDLGADSLDTYELLQSLEQGFSISIAEDEAQNFKTVKDIVQYIDNNQKK